jgi:hypothetical protein
MHSHTGTRLPLPVPRAAASKNLLRSSAAALAAMALRLTTAFDRGVPAQHLAPPPTPNLLLLPAATIALARTRPAADGAGWGRAAGEKAGVAARDSIVLPTAKYAQSI